MVDGQHRDRAFEEEYARMTELRLRQYVATVAGRSPQQQPRPAPRRVARRDFDVSEQQKATLKAALMTRTPATRPRGSGSRFDSDPFGEPRGIGGSRKYADPWDLSAVGFDVLPAARGRELHARALEAIERMQRTTDERREGATRLLEREDTPSTAGCPS